MVRSGNTPLGSGRPTGSYSKYGCLTSEQIAAITFTGDYKKAIRESWNMWDVIATLGVVVLCALFYAYFW